MTPPDQVLCSPLQREERIATVVDEEIVGDTRGPRILLTVELEGHRYRVDAADTQPA